MPTRIAERSLDGTLAKGLFPNHVRNIGIRIFLLLHFCLYSPHLVDVFDQAFRTRIVRDEADPSIRERHGTPRSALGTRNLYVNERPLAMHGAPGTHSL